MSRFTSKPQQVTKLDAARRQLDTAIDLWFFDKDAVSIHTLAFAAYEVIHVVSNSRKRSRDLLFDSILIKEEYRGEYNKMLKSHANFFKHAKKEKDIDAAIEFHPALSEIFILFSILGLELSSEKQTDIESAFMWWFYLHKPHLTTEAGKKFIADNIPNNQIDVLRELKKNDFLQIFLIERQRLRVKQARR